MKWFWHTCPWLCSLDVPMGGCEEAGSWFKPSRHQQRVKRGGKPHTKIIMFWVLVFVQDTLVVVLYIVIYQDSDLPGIVKHP